VLPMPAETCKEDFYNQIYKRRNYFRYPTWIYAPYVSSLVAFCGLKKGDSILDVGCGQGFFSHLFGQHRMRVCGVDISKTGIRNAENLYGRLGISFTVADIMTTEFPEKFDCIFIRSCSLYNTDDFSLRSDVTENLLRHLKVGGTFIFVYNSNFSGRPSSKWRYHSLEEVRKHFSRYPNARFFFLNKMVTCLFRTLSFTPFVTRFNIFLSELSGTGGELVCVFRKTRSDPAGDLRI
jgi:SAM-dependent methyltransferase